jgi:hypothetical protein
MLRALSCMELVWMTVIFMGGVLISGAKKIRRGAELAKGCVLRGYCKKSEDDTGVLGST